MKYLVAFFLVIMKYTLIAAGLFILAAILGTIFVCCFLWTFNFKQSRNILWHIFAWIEEGGIRRTINNSEFIVYFIYTLFVIIFAIGLYIVTF